MAAVFRKVVLLVLVLMLTNAPGARATGAEELVFSTPGFAMNLTGNSSGAPTTGFGFWIWCAAEAASQSRGGYQNAHACQGSMYFYGLDKHATPIVGFATEGPDGIYTVLAQQGTFAQLKAAGFGPIPDSPYACSLTNDTPDPKGPGNGVTVNCAFGPALGGGFGHADVTNAVTNVTGG